MPDYGANGFMDVWARLVAIIFIIYFWICVRRGWFDLRFRGFDTLISYTKWRVIVLLGSIVVFQAIPLVILGEQFSDLFQARDTLVGLYLFWGNVIGIPLAIIVATLGQIQENRRNRKSKRKNS